MSEFVELLPDEEYEALRKKGISLIRQATKESMLEWLRYDNECIMLEMQEDFISGKPVTFVSLVTSEPVVITKSGFTASNDDYTMLSLAA
jgi:hypothetical protein